MIHFEKLIGWIARINGVVATLFFVALTVVVTMQVFTRFVLYAPVIWSEEAARFLFFWTVLLGAALSVHHRRHFVIDVVPEAPDAGPRGPIGTFWRLIPGLVIVGFSVFLLIQGISYTEIGTFRTGTNSRVNMSLVYAAIPIFAGLSILYGLLQLVQDIRLARRGIPRAPVQPPAD